jgi:hypothetical protein
VTSEQTSLLGYPETEKKLGVRQTLVLLRLQAMGQTTDDEAGALIHANRGKHDESVRCDWCAREGRDVLVSLRRHGLVLRRRSGQWERKGVRGSQRGSGPSTYNQLPEGF